MKKRILMLLSLLGINEHLNAQQKSDIASAAYQAVPSTTAATGFTAMGVSASEWLVLLSIGFVVLQAAQLIWKWRRDYINETRRDIETGKARDNQCAPAAESER